MRTQFSIAIPIAAFSFLMLAACTETAPKKEESPPPVEKVEAAPEAPPPLEDLSPSAHIRQAMVLIQDGDPDTARRHLEAALVKKPRNSVARQLLRQLDADPEEMLGKQSFDYKVKSGESLSVVAKKFTGDPLMFVILARYNGIDKPGRLEVGRTLRIPEKYRGAQPVAKPAVTEEMDAEDRAAMASAIAGAEAMKPAVVAPIVETKPEPPVVQTAPAVTTAEPEPSAAERAYAEAEGLYRRGNYKEAVIKLEMAVMSAPVDKSRYRGLLVDSYVGYAKQLVRADDLHKAREILNRATELDPANDKILADLARVEDRIEAGKLFKAGQAQRSSGQLEQAYQSFKGAATYDGGNAAYRKALEETRDELAEQYHRKAMEHYRKEELVEAKSYWRKVLEIDPENSLAPGYLSKVEEIQKRLRGFENK